jgi:hypothetical protein
MNSKRMFDNGKRLQEGHVLLGAVVLLALSMLTVTGLLKLSTSSIRSSYASKVRTREYTNSEASIGDAVSWMRANSQALLSAFRRDEFYDRFTRTDPSIGDNDDSIFQIPTRIKLAGTNDSAFVVTDLSMGTPEFPSLTNIVTLASFPFVSNFQTADVGPSMVRITLLDAIAEDLTKDFGAPPSADPTTDFRPVYRIDSMTATNSGGHVYAIVTTDLLNLFDIGFYGQDYLEFRQACDSYKSANGAYSNATKRANCTVGSNSTSQIHKSETIYGSLRTNGTINEESPYGGDVCSDFASGCPNEGEKCSGEDCSVPLLEQFQAWAVYCPTHQGDIAPATSTLTLAGTAPAQVCWNKLTVNNNTTVTLSATNSPYFFKTIDLKNSSNSRLNIQPNPATGKVEVYVETIVGNAINGNQAFNANNTPGQFSLYYLGTNALTFNGNAQFRGTIVAPKARVNVSGSFEYYGALLAKELALNGAGNVHYDESLSGNGKVSDIQFKIVEIGQRYR